MQRSGAFRPYLIAAAIGIGLWLATAALGGRREACDSGLYWSLAYPAAIVACAVLGYRFPQRPWRWALVLFEAQMLPMLVASGEVSGLWPLGMALLAVLAVPGMLVAHLAARRASSDA